MISGNRWYARMKNCRTISSIERMQGMGWKAANKLEKEMIMARI